MKKLKLESLGIETQEILSRNESRNVTSSTGSGAGTSCSLFCRYCPEPYETKPYYVSIQNCYGECSTDSANLSVTCSRPQITVTCTAAGLISECLGLGSDGSGSGSGSGSRGSKKNG